MHHSCWGLSTRQNCLPLVFKLCSGKRRKRRLCLETTVNSGSVSNIFCSKWIPAFLHCQYQSAERRGYRARRQVCRHGEASRGRPLVLRAGAHQVCVRGERAGPGLIARSLAPSERGQCIPFLFPPKISWSAADTITRGAAAWDGHWTREAVRGFKTKGGMLRTHTQLFTRFSLQAI